MKQRTLLNLFFAALVFTFGACKKNTIDSPILTVTAVADSIEIAIRFADSYPLDNDLEEASGLEIDANGLLWTHNDHGNPPLLFGVNMEGETERIIELEGVDNTDWEDLAFDDNGNLYIGNFGNNDNDRKDLSIYVLPDFSTQNASRITPSVFPFTFENQVSFPPSDRQLHFDTEAFIVHENYIYLFTKDRSSPFEGITNLYQLPMASAGENEAKLLSTFATSNSKKEGAITAADISPDGKKLILLSEQKIFLFTNFQQSNFFGGDLFEFSIPLERKFEGVAFINNCELRLVNEKKYGEDAQLLSLEICD